MECNRGASSARVIWVDDEHDDVYEQHFHLELHFHGARRSGSPAKASFSVDY